MPATKNNKNTPTDPAKPSKKEQGEGAIPGTEREHYRAARTLRALAQTGPKPPPPTRYEEWEEEALDFLTRYHALGQALVRAGFTKGSQTHGVMLPNWEQFALHIEERFDPDSDLVVQGAVAHLNWEPENLARRNAPLTRPISGRPTTWTTTWSGWRKGSSASRTNSPMRSTIWTGSPVTVFSFPPSCSS